MPGMGELIIILLIVLVVFGANKLPGIGDALGRSIKNFRMLPTISCFAPTALRHLFKARPENRRSLSKVVKRKTEKILLRPIQSDFFIN